MRVIETLQQVGDRLQLAMVVGSVPVDGSGNISVLFANNAAATLFGYPNGSAMLGLDVMKLMPSDVAKRHQANVDGYMTKGNRSANSIMGTWRNLEGLRRDGTTVLIQANVADIKNSEERYFVAIFRDRTEDARQARQLEQALEEAQQLQEMSEKARQEADRMRHEADEARRAAEDGLLRQKRLSGQIMLLRQIFLGTMGLVIMLGLLIATQWFTGRADPDGLAMVERVLLVLTGILGSAMASVFDSRNRTGE